MAAAVPEHQHSGTDFRLRRLQLRERAESTLKMNHGAMEMA